MAYLERDIRRLVGKAIHKYRLIEEGDRILVALSGGKDSLSMLQLLHERRPRVPTKYDLSVLTVDLGYRENSMGSLGEHVRKMGYEFVLKKTNIGELAHGAFNKENPCFLCARLRRKIFFDEARNLGCNKVALGHNRDDIIETFFLNVFYCGEISTIVPRQELFGGELSIIRPLAMVSEEKIRRYAEGRTFPAVVDGCPTKGATRRWEIKRWVAEVSKENRRIKSNIFRALSNVRCDYLLGDGNGPVP